MRLPLIGTDRQSLLRTFKCLLIAVITRDLKIVKYCISHSWMWQVAQKRHVDMYCSCEYVTFYRFLQIKGLKY